MRAVHPRREALRGVLTDDWKAVDKSVDVTGGKSGLARSAQFRAGLL